MADTLHFKLEEEDFRRLVAGGTTDFATPDGTTVRLRLADIGFDRMTAAIDRAALRVLHGRRRVAAV